MRNQIFAAPKDILDGFDTLANEAAIPEEERYENYKVFLSGYTACMSQINAKLKKIETENHIKEFFDEILRIDDDIRTHMKRVAETEQRIEEANGSLI